MHTTFYFLCFERFIEFFLLGQLSLIICQLPFASSICVYGYDYEHNELQSRNFEVKPKLLSRDIYLF
jgi:hypothetical protein